MKKIIIEKRVGKGLSIVDDLSTVFNEKLAEKREIFGDICEEKSHKR